MSDTRGSREDSAARPKSRHGARSRRMPPPRTALTINEACESLGVGWDLFHQSIEPELKIVRIGRRKLVPLTELQAWLDRNAQRLL